MWHFALKSWWNLATGLRPALKTTSKKKVSHFHSLFFYKKVPPDYLTHVCCPHFCLHSSNTQLRRQPSLGNYTHYNNTWSFLEVIWHRSGFHEHISERQTPRRKLMRSEEEKKEAAYLSLCIWRSCGAELMSIKMQHQPEGRIASEFKDAVCKSSINPTSVEKTRN